MTATPSDNDNRELCWHFDGLSSTYRDWNVALNGTVPGPIYVCIEPWGCVELVNGVNNKFNRTGSGAVHRWNFEYQLSLSHGRVRRSQRGIPS